MTNNGNTATAGRFAKFDAETQEGEPIGFELAGEKFSCMPIAPAGALAHLLRVAGTVITTAEAVTFIEEFIDDDNIERFRTVIHRKNPVVPGKLLTQVINFLIDSYTGRPIQPPVS